MQRGSVGKAAPVLPKLKSPHGYQASKSSSSTTGHSGTESESSGKRNSSELDLDNIGPDELKRQICRLAQDNSSLKQALNKSQEEVKKLKAVIEMHESQKKSKEDKSQSRYWTEVEHQRFLDALQTVGPKDVKAIAQFVGTRSATQVRTHAQKYFIKLARMKKSAEEAAKTGGPDAAQAWWLKVRRLDLLECS
eukprot:753131-Hanusia_phi.AAC.3